MRNQTHEHERFQHTMCRIVRRRTPLLLIALIQGLFPAISASQIKPAASTASTITGSIVDEAGLPVEGARVSIPATALTAVSDVGGVFRLTGVQPGVSSIEVAKQGFSTLIFDFEIAATVMVSLKLTLFSLPPPQSQIGRAHV